MLGFSQKELESKQEEIEELTGERNKLRLIKQMQEEKIADLEHKIEVTLNQDIAYLREQMERGMRDLEEAKKLASEYESELEERQRRIGELEADQQQLIRNTQELLALNQE